MGTSEEYIWLFERKESGELAGSILGSVLFHALMFAILASTTIFNPLPGESDEVAVLWYYPSLSPGRRPAPAASPRSPMAARAEKAQIQARPALAHVPAKAPKTDTAPAKAPEARAAHTKAIEHEKAAEMKPPPPPPPHSASVTEAARPVITVPEEEPETEPEMVIPAAIESPPKTVAAPKAEKPVEKKIAERENDRVAAAKAIPSVEERKIPEPPKGRETPQAEVKPASPVSAPVAAAPLRSLVAKGVARTTTPGPAAVGGPLAGQATPARGEKPTAAEAQTGQAESAAPSSLPAAAIAPSRPKGEEGKETAAAPQGAPRPAGIVGEAKGHAAGKEVRAAPAAKTTSETKNSEKTRIGAAEAKGIFFPPVTGDLKLEMNGKDELLRRLKVVVLFREYPKARRNRPLSRAEFRRPRTLTPRVVRSGEGSRQAVIEIAGEGIYEFMVESSAEEPDTAVFTLKLYEKSSRARTKPLGSRRIAHSESVVKVLMPEGILWSEDAAFTGSIEASDGVTKFNSDTGLLWKEYK